MAFNNTYNFTSLASAEANWNVSDPLGTGIQTANTQRRVCWHNAATASNGAGPDSGQGDAGYLYTEMSGAGVNGDVFTFELDVNFDASTNNIVFGYYFGYRGDGNNGNIQLQSNESGAGWINRGPAEIIDQAGTPLSGTFVWLEKSIDLTGLISSASTRFRLVLTQGSAGTNWHKDVGIDTVTVVGTDIGGGSGVNYNLNGSTIEVTGIGDHNQADFNNVAGVSCLLTGSGDEADETCNYGGNSFELLSGTELNINPWTQKIITQATGNDNGLVVRNGAILNINGSNDFDGIIGYTERMWFIHNGPYENFNVSGFTIENGATLNWNGGGIRMSKAIQFDPNSIIRITRAIIDTRDYDLNGVPTALEQQIRQESTDAIFEDVTFYRTFLTMIAIPTLINPRPRQCSQFLSFSGFTPDINIPIPGYDTDGSNVKDVGLWAGCQPVLINSVTGVLCKVGPNSVNGGSSAYGLLRMLAIVDYDVLDENDQPIDEYYVIRLRDSDSGNRKTYNRERWAANPYNAERDFSYVGRSVSNVLQQIIVTRLNCQSAGIIGDVASTVNTGLTAPDYRIDNANVFNEDTDTPLMNMNYWAYGKTLTQSNTSFLGAPNENIKASAKLFSDLNVSVDYATASSYTVCDTNQSIFDAQQAWYKDLLDTMEQDVDKITDNTLGWDIQPVMGVTAETQRAIIETLGGVGVLPIDINGVTNYPLNFINDTNPNPFQFDGTTITIYADGIIEADITSTGVVSGDELTGGDVVVQGTITDVNGVRSSVTISIEVLDEDTGLPIENARVEILNSITKARIIDPLETDASGTVSTTIIYSQDINIEGWVRQFDLSGNDYVPKDYNGTITNNGFNLLITLKQI